MSGSSSKHTYVRVDYKDIFCIRLPYTNLSVAASCNCHDNMVPDHPDVGKECPCYEKRRRYRNDLVWCRLKRKRYRKTYKRKIRKIRKNNQKIGRC